VPELAASDADSSIVVRRIGSSSRVVTMRQANRVPAPPAAGLRAIDPSPFRLRLERLGAPPGHGLGRVVLDRRLRRFGPRGNVPLAARLARGLRGGFRWDDEDSRTKDWYPQGIDGRGDILLVSWYSKRDGAARLSIADTATGRYGHVALVMPDGKPVKTHAGGLAWREDYVYVADTTGGLRLFDLRRFAGRTLPQAGWYRPATKDLRFSYASIDAANGSLLVGEYRDKEPGARFVRWPFASGGLLAQEEASEAWTTAHTNLQGATVHDGRMLMARSRASRREGTLTVSPFDETAERQLWPIGCEDLAVVGGDVVSLTEHPDMPRPLARRRTVFRATPR
jgi:hypothetical protein